MPVLHVRDIPDDLHRAARIAAIEDGISLRELVIEALRNEVARRRAIRRTTAETRQRVDDNDDDDA